MKTSSHIQHSVFCFPNVIKNFPSIYLFLLLVSLAQTNNNNIILDSYNMPNIKKESERLNDKNYKDEQTDNTRNIFD